LQKSNWFTSNQSVNLPNADAVW